MTYEAKTIKEYMSLLPDNRQEPFRMLIDIINANLPHGFEHQMQYGMPSWVVPLSKYPDGYHCTPETPLSFISLASQKHYIAMYHAGIYADAQLLSWFRSEYSSLNIGKPDMGKSCIRFKNKTKIPYALIRDLCKKITVEQWIKMYEKIRQK